jgi:hypothetical protein
VKAKANVSLADIKSLRALAEEQQLKRYLCVSLEPRARILAGVTIVPFQEFLETLWGGGYA